MLRNSLLRCCRWPLLGEPGRQRFSCAADGQLAVLVAPTLGQACECARHLEIDLQPVAIRVEEVDTALVHVVHRALDAYAVLKQRAIGLSQRLVARHWKAMWATPRGRAGPLAVSGLSCGAMSKV